MTDTVCRFCELQSQEFESEQAIDKHYSEACVMLTSCGLCSLFIEITKLSDHMLNECTNRQLVSECETCGDISADQHQKCVIV